MNHDNSTSEPDSADLDDRDDSSPAAETSDAGQEAESEAEPEGTRDEPPLGAVDYAMRRRIQNRMTDGRLIAHFTTRDVTFSMDGATALDVMSDWQRRPVFMQQLEPTHASAELTWLGIDLTNVLGFSWHPRRPDRDIAECDRRAFDGSF